MSHRDYERSKEIVQDHPDFEFNALIMAAVRKSTPAVYDRLRECFPAVCVEFNQRMHSPGGRLPGDKE
jgi:hypothetical protein